MTPPPRWDESMRRRVPAHWGVDSKERSNLQVTWQGQPMTHFEYVVARIGRPPDFWGRYIGSGARAHSNNRFDGTEIQFLHGMNCRIGLIYNGHRMRPQDRIPRGPNEARRLRGYESGHWAAKWAIYHADELRPRPPDGIRIYADLENWEVDQHWIRGWQDMMCGSRYAGSGGLYGRSGYSVTNSAYLRRIGQRQFHDQNQYDPQQWTRRGPSNWSDAAMRAGVKFDRAQRQAIDNLDVPTFRRFSRHVWTNDPRRYGDPQTDVELFPTTFSPTAVPGGSVSTVWQYRIQCYIDRAGGGGPLDLDYADDSAFNEMWGRSS